MAEEASYFSRFTVKFVEIMAAGIATAVSGYVLAHLGGYMSAPASPPPVAVAAPATTEQPKAVSASQRPSEGSAIAVGSGSRPPVAETKEPPRKGASTARTEPARKRGSTETGAIEEKPRAVEEKPRQVEEKPRQAEEKPRQVEDKPRQVEEKPREAEAKSARDAEIKARDAQSLDAQIRAALANSDANRPVPSTAPHAVDAPPAAAAAAPQSQPAEAPPAAASAKLQPQPQAQPTEDALSTSAVAPGSHAADAAPSTAKAAPIELQPLPSVEVKSQPVATVDASPPAPAEQQVQSDEGGIFSVFKKIPEFLRSDSPSRDGEVPRPPKPVGQ